VFMVTPDKDYHQLVTEQISVYKPGRQGNSFEIMGIPLMGDASDNVPGIRGIGEKTAQKLIAKFGSIEKLLESTDELKGKQKEKVIDGHDVALLSKKLVTIKIDVPHELRLNDFVMVDAIRTRSRRKRSTTFRISITASKRPSNAPI